MSITDPDAPKTAFVFAGGGSFGAVQVGMLQALAAHGVVADMVVGSSVGALNGAFYAGDPSVSGVARLAEIWRGLNRQDVFPVTWRTLVSILWRRDFLIPHDGVRKLIDDYIPFRNLEDARMPLYIVTTDIISGDSVVLSEGSTADAIVASTAIPGAFTPVHYRDRYLADGAISSNTPVRVAVKHGAKRLIVLPTGHACANQAPPVGALANALHALTLLIARQLVNELENIGPGVEYFVVPPLCPLVGSPYDFSRTSDHITRALDTTNAWLDGDGLKPGHIPHELQPHDH
ncbi:patatin-like phospholipase family protein [Bradyrhizobium mercantei]|uniref:patatin-like phospholipase family protein n=1 Tax=Bradyrhizobium mercantei TaxID=1904807 RepID=UPI001FD9C81D|nr:patatin-like phospholipase family protein [Bradyrhizobium mercantei]